MKILEQIVRFGVVAAIIVAAVYFGGRLLVGFVSSEPGMLSLNPNAERGGCPGTPNCVSSYAETPEHEIDPIACSADDATKIAVFHDAVSTLPDMERLGDTHWVVYSRIFRFRDDVRIQTSPRGIEVYSASRLGAGDLGANRNRVEYLREQVAEDERCL